MELDGDVDVAEFTQSELRRQQLQSYIIKVLQPGTDDAIKIQHYHRLAVLFETATDDWNKLAEENPNADQSVDVLFRLLANLILLNNDDEMLIAVLRFVSAAGQDIRILANTEDSESDMTEKMLGLIRRAPASSPLSVFALGVLALLLRPQEYEVEAVRYIATTELPEALLRRAQETIQAIDSRAHRGPFVAGKGNPIETSLDVVYEPASVNEEVDVEEPTLRELVVRKASLKYWEFTWTLDIWTQVGQYVDVLGAVLQNGGVELVRFLLTSESPTLVSYAYCLLTALLTHPKFSSVFLARDGLLLLLARPCASECNAFTYNKFLSGVVNNLVQFPNTIEQICLMHEQALIQFMELIFWLLSSAQEEALKNLLLCLSRILVYETVTDIFQRQNHISVLLKMWKFCQAIVDGNLPNPHDVAGRAPVIRGTRDGVEFEIHGLPLDLGEAVPATSDGLEVDRTMHLDNGHNGDFSNAAPSSSTSTNNQQQKPSKTSEIPSFPHLNSLSQSSARSLIDHLLLVLSEYFAASFVQENSTNRRSQGFDTSAPTPRYRATNVSYENLAVHLTHRQIYSSIEDAELFQNQGGLELVFQTIQSNVQLVAHSQTSTDIVIAGLKLLWILSALPVVGNALLKLSIKIPENSSSQRENYIRQLTARVSELLRPENIGNGDIPIIHGLNNTMWAQGGDADLGEAQDGDIEIRGDLIAPTGLPAGAAAAALGATAAAPSGVQAGGGGGYLDRMDLSNIRLEPVNQRLTLQRATSRQAAENAAPSTALPVIPNTSTPAATQESAPATQASLRTAADSSIDERPTQVAFNGRRQNNTTQAASMQMDVDEPHSEAEGPNGISAPSDEPTTATTATTTTATSTTNDFASAPASQTQPTSTEPQKVEPKDRSRSSFSILMGLLRRLSTPSPTAALFILHIFKSYTHNMNCAMCSQTQWYGAFHKGSSTSSDNIDIISKKVVAEIRASNGLAELVGLLKFQDIIVSTHIAIGSTVVTDWNIVRAHAMSLMRDLAAHDEPTRQILAKKLHATLPDILRAPCPPGLEKTFAKFKEEAMSFLSLTGGGALFKREEQLRETSALSKLERTAIIASTPIRYAQQDLLELIYQHLHANGLHKAAQALVEDANLKVETFRPPPAPPISSQRPRPRRQSMLTGPANLSSSSIATPGPAIQPVNPDIPHSDAGFINEQTPQISLDTIMKQYLFEQHKHCRHPVQQLPDLSLLSSHTCPEPSRHRMNPYGSSSMNLGHRRIAQSIGHQSMNSSMWRRYKYSRFAPRRKFADGGRLTSVTFVDNDSIYFGSGEGMVVRYSVSNVNYENEWEVRDGPVDLKISKKSSRVLTMCEASQAILGAPNAIDIWDLSNMSHSLGTLPYVTADFSPSGQEVLGINSEGLAQLWDIASGTVVRSYHAPSNTDDAFRNNKQAELVPGCFSPDDSLVLHNSSLWDKRASSPIHSFDRFGTHGSHIFAPSGLEIITNTEIWDSRTFKLIKTVPSLLKAHLTFSHAGDVLYAGGRNRFELLDASTYDHISQVTLEAHFASLSINPDDTQVAVLENLSPDRWTAESAWRIWDIGTSRTLDDEDGSDSEEDDADEMAEFDTDDEDGVVIHGHGDEMDLDEDDGDDDSLGDLNELADDDDDDDDDDHMDDDDDGDLDDDGEPIFFDSDGEEIPIADFDVEGDGTGDEDDEILFGEEAAEDDSYDGPVFVMQEGSSDAGFHSSDAGSAVGGPFAELPSDEEAANELLEHGNMPMDASSSEPSVMEFGGSDEDLEEASEEEVSSLRRRGIGAGRAALLRDRNRAQTRLRGRARGASGGSTADRLQIHRQSLSRLLAMFGNKRTGSATTSSGPIVEEPSEGEHSEDESSAEVVERRRFSAKRAGSTAPRPEEDREVPSEDEEEARETRTKRSASKSKKKKR